MDQLKIDEFWRKVEKVLPKIFLYGGLGQETREYYAYLHQLQEDEDDIRESITEEFEDQISSLEDKKSELEDEVFDLENEIEKLKDLLDENGIEYE